MTNHDQGPKSPAAKGIQAILRTAAANSSGAPDLDLEMRKLIDERERTYASGPGTQGANANHGGYQGLPLGTNYPRPIPTATLAAASPPPIPSSRSELRPLDPEAEALLRKGVILPAEQMQTEMLDGATQILREAEELVADVERWGKEQIYNAQQMAARIATDHAALRRARRHFQAAMNGEPEELPNPLEPVAKPRAPTPEIGAGSRSDSPTQEEPPHDKL